jgi:multiple sugar transport system permease protein
MTALARWRAGAFVAMTAGALLPLTLAQWARGRYERALAARDATAAAAYLTIVTPPPPAGRGAGYDLPQLLIRARALEELPGLSGRFEIYYATAPLVHATAPPLPAATLQRVRREVAVRWTGDAALAPLFDRDGWDVVGAVAARPAARGWPISPWSLGALLLLLVAGGQSVGVIGRPPPAWRQTFRPYGIVAVLFGVAVFAEVRGAAGDATDRWLYDTRLLMQEAAARIPEIRSAPAGLTTLTREGGAEIVPGDSGPAAAWRRAPGGVPTAVVAVRLAPGRWVELRSRPGEAGTAGWLPVMLGLAALGPLGALIAAWSTASAPRPRRETVAAWGFLAPSALHLAAFSLFPLLLVLHVSLHRWSPIEPTRPFVALANYGHVVRDPLVWSALGRTLLYALYVPVSMALALGLALLIGGRRRSGAATPVLRALFLVPYASSVVAVALVWQWMYHPDFGLINHLLTRAGLGPVNWLGDPKTALLAVMLVSVWMQLGYQLTVFLAGLRAIPQAYLDAARVDGANAWQRFWRVTFPLLAPVTLFVLVTGIIGAFQVFALVMVLTAGGPLGATDVIVHRIYQTAWDLLQFGDASALALLLFAVLFGVTWFQLKLLDRRVEYA